MDIPSRRAGLCLLATALALALPAAAQQARRAPADAPVYIVSSQKTHALIGTFARNAAIRADATGQTLVIAETRASQLGTIAELVHRNEKRCGGYFAFDSRAAAEAFVQRDRSAQAIAAAPIAYTVDNQATVNPWLNQVSEAKLYGTINSLQGYRNRYYTSSYGTASAEWIRNQWAALASGRNDANAALFTDCSNCSTQPSVILTVQGSEAPSEVVVVGAHLDSISGSGSEQVAPGADDDASGVAAVTEVIRVALASGWKPRRTVKFMAYAAEEVGLRGSNAIAQRFRNSGVDVVGVLQLDMTNYKSGTPEDMQLVTDYSSASLKTFFVNLFDAYLKPRGLTRGTITCGYGCSDHASWTSAGYPAGMMFEAGDDAGKNTDAFRGTNPKIHSSGDTLQFMGESAANTVKFAQFGLAFVGELGKTAGAGPGPGPAPGGVLTKGVTVTGLSASAGADVAYTLSVPAGARNLVFSSSGGSGDADMYVKFGSKPTDSSYDCRPYKSGNAESCTIASPSAGTWHVRMKAYSAFSGLSLVGNFDAGSAGDGDDSVSLPTVASGNWSPTYTMDVAAGETATIKISGGTGDADLYVRAGSAPTTTSYTCRPYKTGNNESCTLKPASATTYYITVRAYSTFSGVTLSTSAR